MDLRARCNLARSDTADHSVRSESHTVANFASHNSLASSQRKQTKSYGEPYSEAIPQTWTRCVPKPKMPRKIQPACVNIFCFHHLTVKDLPIKEILGGNSRCGP